MNKEEVNLRSESAKAKWEVQSNGKLMDPQDQADV
jgi:hypothetical protein